MAKIFKFLPLNLIPVSTNEKTFSFKENFTIKMGKKGEKRLFSKLTNFVTKTRLTG